MQSPVREVILSHADSLQMRGAHTFNELTCIFEAQMNPCLVLDAMHLNSEASGSFREPRHQSSKRCTYFHGSTLQTSSYIPLYCCDESFGMLPLLWSYYL